MSNTWKLAIAGMVGFLLGVSIAALIGPIPPDVKVWERRVEAYQRDSAAYERMLATFAGERARLEDSARAAEGRRVAAVALADNAGRQSRQARRRADSAIAALDSMTTAADSLPVVVAAYTARTEEANQAHTEADGLRSALGNAVAESLVLRGVINTRDSVIATVTKRLAIADDLLRDRPATDRCRVLWFKCPSRTASFVVGALAGVAGGVYVATR